MSLPLSCLPVSRAPLWLSPVSDPPPTPNSTLLARRQVLAPPRDDQEAVWGPVDADAGEAYVGRCGYKEEGGRGCKPEGAVSESRTGSFVHVSSLRVVSSSGGRGEDTNQD